MKKGQTIEILGFLALVVAVIISMLGLRLVTVNQKYDVMHLAQESQEIESFNSGAKTFMSITEKSTKKSFTELMGLMGLFQKERLELGPKGNTITVNVTEEITKNLDLIYGTGHWYLEIPHTPRYQVYVIIILDVSKSMKDEINNIKSRIHAIIEKVKETTGRRVAYRFYFLPTGDIYRDSFNDIAKNNPDFKAFTISGAGSCTGTSTSVKNEAWAKGMLCVIREKKEEWTGTTAKVGVIISDEPPSGCETCGCDHYNGDKTENCCPDPIPASCQNDAGFSLGPPPSMSSGCASKMNDIELLIEEANKINMNIFTLQADPCALPINTPQCSYPKPYTCAGREELRGFMDYLSRNTNATMEDVEDSKVVADKLEKIVLSQPVPEGSFKLGTIPPTGKRIHSIVIPAPTAVPGHYVNVILKQWN